MKAAVLGGRGFVFEERPVPACGPDQVLVKSAGCGICEGDVFQYVTRLANPGCQEGCVPLGHEGSGIVAAVGSNVREFQPGDRVTSLYGDYAEYFLAAKEHLARVPAAIDIRMALGEPIACAMHGAWRFGVNFGDRVAIIGCGYMGLNCLQLAKLRGAAEIVALDLLDWRLATARQLGADRVLNSSGRSAGELFAALGEFDVVIEATGAQAAIDLGTVLLRQHGTLNLVGYHQSDGGRRTIDMKTWNYKALTVNNSHVRSHAEKLVAMKAALQLLASGKLLAAPLVTNYHFAQINEAFQDLKARKEGLYKANLVAFDGLDPAAANPGKSRVAAA